MRSHRLLIEHADVKIQLLRGRPLLVETHEDRSPVLARDPRHYLLDDAFSLSLLDDQRTLDAGDDDGRSDVGLLQDCLKVPLQVAQSIELAGLDPDREVRLAPTEHRV